MQNRGPSDHGERLSGAEFDRRVADLHLSLPEHPTPEEERAVERLEFDLTVDYRLGVDFPEGRREALWAVQQRVRHRSLRTLIAWHLGKALPRFLASTAHRLAAGVIEDYEKILTPREMDSFFGEEEVLAPGLPIDQAPPNEQR